MRGVSGQNMVLSVMEGKISLQKLSCRFGRGNDAVIQTECMGQKPQMRFVCGATLLKHWLRSSSVGGPGVSHGWRGIDQQPEYV